MKELRQLQKIRINRIAELERFLAEQKSATAKLTEAYAAAELEILDLRAAVKSFQSEITLKEQRIAELTKERDKYKAQRDSARKRNWIFGAIAVVATVLVFR